jgi:hypothetical protein
MAAPDTTVSADLAVLAGSPVLVDSTVPGSASHGEEGFVWNFDGVVLTAGEVRELLEAENVMRRSASTQAKYAEVFIYLVSE